MYIEKDEFDRLYPTFECWLAHVNLYLSKKIFVESQDLPDRLWMDDFDNGRHPFAAAKIAVREFKSEHGIE